MEAAVGPGRRAGGGARLGADPASPSGRRSCIDDDTNLTLDGLLTWLRASSPRRAGASPRTPAATASSPALAPTRGRAGADLQARAGRPDRHGRSRPTAGRPGAVPAASCCCAAGRPGMYAARVRIAVASLCRLLHGAGPARAADRPLPGVVLLDVTDLAARPRRRRRRHHRRRQRRGPRPSTCAGTSSPRSSTSTPQRGRRAAAGSRTSARTACCCRYEDTVTADDESCLGLFDFERDRPV